MQKEQPDEIRVIDFSVAMSIEIRSDYTIYSDLNPFEVVGFLLGFDFLDKEDINFFKMNEGMVNFNQKDVVISFGISLYPTHFKVKNLLSSLDWEETKEFVKKAVERNMN